MCNCSKASCGACNTIKQQRGKSGDLGPRGFAAQVSDGNGPPVSDLGEAYGLYQDGALGGNWWQWAPGGPWVDTGIQVSGADGTSGFNAYTTLTGTFTMPIVGGVGSLPVVNGDWAVAGQKIFVFGLGCLRVQLPSPNLIVVSNEGGSTNAASGTQAFAGAGVSPAGEPGADGLPGLTYIASGAVLPVGLQPGFNSGIFYQTPGFIYIWDGTGWVNTGVPTTGGGGGGGIGSLAQVAATPGVTPYNQPGDMGGDNVWYQRRVMNIIPVAESANAGTTHFFDITNAKSTLAMLGTNITLDWIPNGSPYDCERTFELYNASSPAVQIPIFYAAQKWSKNDNIAHPTQLPPGGRVSLICRYFQGRMNIINVQQGIVII